MTTDKSGAEAPGHVASPQQGDEDSWEALANKDFDRILSIARDTFDGDTPQEASSPAGNGSPKPAGESEKGTQGKPKIPPEGDQPVSSDSDTDPLAKSTLDSLLKHPVLGPQLNSWMDRGVNARTTQLRERIKSEVTPEIIRDQRFKEDKEYLEGLSSAERGQVLSQDEELASTWATIQADKQRQPNPTANPEAVARTAQVYAYAGQIRAVDQMIQNSDLSDDVKTSLMDESQLRGKGPEGLTDWTQRVMDAIAEAKASATAETRFESLLEERKAQLPNRPGLTPPGRRQAPQPDFATGSSDSFKSAF